jgi:hypothetical protein
LINFLACLINEDFNIFVSCFFAITLTNN